MKKSWDLSPDDNSCFEINPMVGQGTQERFKGSSSTKTGFRAYPSPTSEGIFTLEIPKSEALGGDFSLMDVSSKVWLFQKIQPSQTTAQFDVSQMPNGLYLYTYKGLDGKAHAGKIIVQNN